MRNFGKKVLKGTQENCLAIIILYANKELKITAKQSKSKTTTATTNRPLNPLTLLSQIIYLVYVKIC